MNGKRGMEDSSYVPNEKTAYEGRRKKFLEDITQHVREVYPNAHVTYHKLPENSRVDFEMDSPNAISNNLRYTSVFEIRMSSGLIFKRKSVPVVVGKAKPQSLNHEITAIAVKDNRGLQWKLEHTARGYRDYFHPVVGAYKEVTGKQENSVDDSHKK